MQKNYTVDSAETLERKIAEVREAQAKFATYYAGAGRQDLQGRCDGGQPAAHSAGARWRSKRPAWASWKTRSSRTTTRPNISTTPIKNTKTCGVIEEDKAFGIKKIAEPLGVMAAVIPDDQPHLHGHFQNADLA